MQAYRQEDVSNVHLRAPVEDEYRVAPRAQRNRAYERAARLRTDAVGGAHRARPAGERRHELEVGRDAPDVGALDRVERTVHVLTRTSERGT